MNSSRSQLAARFGALAEKVARRRYGLEVAHSSWHDAISEDGTPWDVKAVMVTRRAPRFRLWKDQHRKLASADGGYVFVAYRAHARGIVPEDTRSVRARSLRVRFGGAGDHPKGEQCKLPPSAVLG